MDLFRFLAALGIIFFHYTFSAQAVGQLTSISFSLLGSFSKYGFLGVNFFFMISGFVILMSAFGKTAWRFAYSRAKRLYPAFWLSVSLTAIVVYFWGGSLFHVHLFQYLQNLSMISSFFGVENIDGVYWTLGVELRFYFLIFLLLFFKKMDKVEPLLALWLIPSFIHSFFGTVSVLRFFLVLEWSPYFIAGSVFYLIKKHGTSALRWLILLAAYFLSIKNTLHTIPEMQTYYKATFSPVLIVILISIFYLIFFLMAFGKTKALSRKWMLTLGFMSYPLYLVHQNSGIIMLSKFGEMMNKYVLLGGVILLMFLISYVIHWVTERKIPSMIKS